jgi:hypothetical protein
LNSKSTAIVHFISNLMPLYVSEQHSGSSCARSLVDGTLIFPIVETECSDADQDHGLIKILWQGDSNRVSEVQGSEYAILAVVRYIEIHHLGHPAEVIRAELDELLQHFSFKTGDNLYFPYPYEVTTGQIINKAIKRFGEAGLVELLKKSIGL